VNWKLNMAVAACIAALVLPLMVGSASAAPAATPGAAAVAPAPAPAPATAPAAASPVIATVGKVNILREQVEAPLRQAPPDTPPDRLAAAREQILGNLILSELMKVYLEAQKATFEPRDVAEMKDQITAAAQQKQMTAAQFMQAAGITEEALKDRARVKKFVETTLAKEKVDAYIKAHPTYFNGTKVQASHILIACKPLASTTEQKEAMDKLTKIAADIKAGKTTFADAAKADSACPSGKKDGGNLGEFEFGSMVPPFAVKAFDMKVGETSGIVRTQFGFHLITVTKRTESKAEAGPDAAKQASNVLMAQLQNEVCDLALTTCPIVMTK
jgi:parvulin-like peptidyl-prolyl isomerase